jgi:chemotaxis protein methyltransferase CheR
MSTGQLPAPAPPNLPPPDGEFAFTRRDFRNIAAILSAEAGISLTDAKAPLVYGRLIKRLRALGMQSFRDYCALVEGPQGAGERATMVKALTTNVTRFFREPNHFEHFRAHVLPGLIAAARRGARVRVWSAGCSSGEEPYSIALTILAHMPDAARFDIKILASDIDTDVLRLGRAGVYADAATAPIDKEMRQRWLAPGRRAGDENNWAVGPELRGLVAFRRLNLVDEWPMKGPFQAIFCRNVLIYFEQETRERIWRQMADLMAPGGHLYVGHSERVHGEPMRFTPVAHTIYRLTDARSREEAP